MIALALAVLVSSQAPSPTVLKFQGMAQSVHSAMSTWINSKEPTCGDPNMVKATTVAFQMLDAAGDQAAALRDPRLGNVQTYLISKDLPQITNLAADEVLSVGELYIKGKCPAQADAVFRDALKSMTGGAYESYRQRALVGISDAQRLAPAP